MNTKRHIKTIFIGLGVFLICSAAYARDGSKNEQDDQATIPTERQIEINHAYGNKKYNDYKGFISNDGYSVLEDKVRGKTVSGHIDDTGYGNLRDESGYRIIKVRPK